MQQPGEELRLRAVAKAQCGGRGAVELGGPAIGDQQRRTGVLGLLEAQEGDGRFFLDVAAHHEDGVAFTELREVAATGQSNLGVQVLRRTHAAQVVAAEHLLKELPKEVHVFIRDTVAHDTRNAVRVFGLGAAKLRGGERERLLPGRGH